MSTATLEKRTYQMADFGPESLLPDLHNVSYVHSTVVWDETMTDEDVRYMRYGRVSSILPYMDRNAYTREKHEREMQTVVLENEHIRAAFLPWMGGRLWSLRLDGRELLSMNTVVQPCNLALRNAWCSGGVEWNVSVRGHNMLTCDTLFTELITLPDGTAAVRFYEYERLRGIVYRLEAYLPPESRFLYVQAHIENPQGNGETPMYWWSNIAVPEEKGTRVIVPAKTAVLSLYDAGQYRMLRSDLPLYEQMDLTRPCEITRSLDVFFDIQPKQRPFIAALQNDGIGLVQCSTAKQLGRKLFVWGMGQGGRHWQDFLSDGKARYVEIQAGIAKTQQDHLPMPDGAVWEWLEAYGAISCDIKDASYCDAVGKCDDALEKALPKAQLQGEFHSRGAAIAAAHGEIVINGSGWGALENERRASCGQSPLSKVCRFPEYTISEKQRPWQTLLRTGSLDKLEAAKFPVSYMVAHPWRALLKRAAESAESLYHLGIIAFRDGDLENARAYLERSVHMSASAAGHRALARMDMLSDQKESCLAHYELAMYLAGSMPELELEYAQTLLALKLPQRLAGFIDSLNEAVRCMPRFQYLLASALVELERYDEAEAILLAPLVIPDMREGEVSLFELWTRMYMLKEGITREEAEQNHPLPAALDFRMH